MMMMLTGALTENNRLSRTMGVIKAYNTIMSAYRGEVPCTVTSAKVERADIHFTFVSSEQKDWPYILHWAIHCTDYIHIHCMDVFTLHNMYSTFSH